MQPKEWFELSDVIKASPEKQIWTTIWQSETIGCTKLAPDFQEITIFTHAIAFPSELAEKALSIEWDNVSPGFGNTPEYENEYITSDTRVSLIPGQPGTYLVLEQYFETQDNEELYLHQDLILALKLKPQGDSWINPKEDGSIIAKIERDENNERKSLKIRTDYLRDYLAARKMGVVLCSYFERTQKSKDDPKYWENISAEEGHGWHRTADTYAVNENGHLYGTKAMMIHVGRKNTDYAEDMPIIHSDNEADNTSSTREIEYLGEKNYISMGRLWINKWLPPGLKSVRVGGEKEDSTIFFQVDNNGTSLSGENLYKHKGWLWFKPDIIPEILKRERASLQWHTENTGSIYFHGSSKFHFGINSVGLINIFAKDLKYISEFHKRVLAGFNVAPEGGVSTELLMAQKDGFPADTKAPEWLLSYAFKCFHEAEDETNIKLLRNHDEYTAILSQIHRFRALTQTGLYELANDLNRIFVERLNKDIFIQLTPISKRNKEKNIGSIKALEEMLNSHHDNGKYYDGRNITKHLVATYELRHGLSHLPSSKIYDAFVLAGLEVKNPSYKNGEILIGQYADIIGFLSTVLRNPSLKK